MKSKDAGKICVVIDLDETLVHSSFKVGKGRLSEVILHHWIGMFWCQKCAIFFLSQPLPTTDIFLSRLTKY